MADLMLPSAVLTHLKAGVRTPAAPEPVLITVWVQPAFVTEAKHANPSLTTAQLQAYRLAVFGGFDSGHERRLAGRPAAPFPAAALATDIGVIDFYPPGQLLGRVTFEHDLLELVLNFPGGVLLDAQTATQLDAGNALLALRHVIHGAKPLAEGQLGRGEDRAGGGRGLPTAGAALKQPARFDHRMLPAAARRTLKPVRPAGPDNHSPAQFLGPIEPIKLLF